MAKLLVLMQARPGAIVQPRGSVVGVFDDAATAADMGTEAVQEFIVLQIAGTKATWDGLTDQVWEEWVPPPPNDTPHQRIKRWRRHLVDVPALRARLAPAVDALLVDRVQKRAQREAAYANLSALYDQAKRARKHTGGAGRAAFKAQFASVLDALDQLDTELETLAAATNGLTITAADLVDLGP